MPEVLVTLNKDDAHFCEIDLSDEQWSSLNENNLTSFKMEEFRRPCDAYEDGIFPGASPYKTDKQISHIQRFSNYIEFSKVMLEDTKTWNGEIYLTSQFYEQRKIGWKSPVSMKKEGELVGYCLNGDVYHKDDKDQVYKIIYSLVYPPLISELSAFEELKKKVKVGQNLKLIGDNHELLVQLSEALKKESS